MDGFKTKLSSSLQFRIALALTIVMVIAAMSIGAIGFYSAFHDAHELQDDQLRDIAAMTDAERLTVGQANALAPSELEDPESHFIVQLIDPNSSVATSEPSTDIKFPNNLTNGTKTLLVQHKKWRVFVRPLPSGEKLVVGQRTEVRDEIAEHAGFRTLVPILVLIPFLIVLIIAVLRWMLAPLTKLSAELNARHPEDMRELHSHDLPTELRPFIVSINSMLSRLSLVLEQQRRFVADAAHELRSPLTALSLQTQNLATHALPDAVQGQLHEFRRGLKRANELVEQLLALARAQLDLPTKLQPVSLQLVVKTVFEEMMPLADSKKIEIGLEQNAEVYVEASEVDLVTVLRNLVDNAIRYTNIEGRVDVMIKIDNAWAVIEVQDNGPGISQEEQERVFDPFYRILGSKQTGSGLGLSIVKSIVTKLRGEVAMRCANLSSASGLVAQVKLPLLQRSDFATMDKK
ncbi:ATP-binding protein [Solimicrobium silvestre]|uniref:histidine kinase n=1 Tax=Solimicrobium silvestre TaxID=2099400 RepID=A0A2S9GZU9_9BURK|nr:ATP-binding protein [Solimicrobium silvestre]PRC93223.1 Signal transduction histidine kinase [Solimicrobium silvestre]